MQDALSALNPGQTDPPLEGVGLLQSRVRDLVPLPQVTLQVEKELQAPQFPSEKVNQFKCD